MLILREVLRWQATEVAELLDTSVASVNSALQRARATMAEYDPDAPHEVEVDEDHRELLAQYVDAFERYDIESLVKLLHDDATFSMPPHPIWLVGPEEVGALDAGPGHRVPGRPAAGHPGQRLRGVRVLQARGARAAGSRSPSR